MTLSVIYQLSMMNQHQNESLKEKKGKNLLHKKNYAD
jgi:hypothetical protein